NGGGVAVQSGLKNYVTTNVTNCTFYDNNEYIFIHTWDTLYNQPNGFHNDLFIDNCIVWEPGTDMVKMFYNNDPDNFSMYGYHINHTLLNLTDSVGVPGSLEAFGDGLIFGQYPVFEDTAAGNFRLALCSPAINKGNNLSALNAGLMVDLDSLVRIRYGIVDMGAYEQQDSCDMVATSDLNILSALRLWPNPSASGILHLQMSEDVVSEGRLMIFNVSGQVVFSRNTTILHENTFDLGYLPPGIYQIRFETADEVFAGKWIRPAFGD
ncbi:MAG: T9SS type A sorting domain-containing protein, partial [Saprospiraceae bacterium]|nr:T9SS type A sorting domain-containing protein [Saprospiraceae bacterium]